MDTVPAPYTPVAPYVTERSLDLLASADSALSQVHYEGSHRQRQDPAPMHGSPWATPDLPREVLDAVRVAQEAVRRATTLAQQHVRLHG